MRGRCITLTILLLTTLACSRGEEKDGARGYDELANPDTLEHFTVSDYNTDDPGTQNIDRPAQSVFDSDIDSSVLFSSLWTFDPSGPHADFVFSKNAFHVVDYDGDGDMPYELHGRDLTIYYNDFIKKGRIVYVAKDTLKIKYWNGYGYQSALEP